jgi:hypothetical protein
LGQWSINWAPIALRSVNLAAALQLFIVHWSGLHGNVPT